MTMINNEPFYDIYLNCLNRVNFLKERLDKFPSNANLKKKLRKLRKELKVREAEVIKVITVHNENNPIKINYPNYSKTIILSIDEKNRLRMEEKLEEIIPNSKIKKPPPVEKKLLSHKITLK